MPFDSVNFKTIDPVLKPGREGLRQLSEALRMPMPESFEWCFCYPWQKNECGSAGCAVGLAHILWPNQMTCPRMPPAFDYFGLSEDAGVHILDFDGYECPPDEVTPTMVADAIDRFLETGKVSIQR